MAKVFKVSLVRGSSYLIPGVGSFKKGEPVEVSEEVANKLKGIDELDVKEVPAKSGASKGKAEEAGQTEEGTPSSDESSDEPKSASKKKKR
jgi:hypothetical protein